jgi:hypothetical protein
VFKEVGIIIEYRVPIDFRMQLKPRLNFISTNVVFFIEEWGDVETRHNFLLNEGRAVFETAPGGREHNFETGDGENNALHNQGEARVDAIRRRWRCLVVMQFTTPSMSRKSTFMLPAFNTVEDDLDYAYAVKSDKAKKRDARARAQRDQSVLDHAIRYLLNRPARNSLTVSSGTAKVDCCCDNFNTNNSIGGFAYEDGSTATRAEPSDR